MINNAKGTGSATGIFHFDCARIGGSPVGRPFSDENRSGPNSLPSQREFPSPAQPEIIESVLTERRRELQADPNRIFNVTVFRDREGKLYLQNGQHRLVASCLESRKVGFQIKSIGFPAGPGSWEQAKNVTDLIPAKERLKRP